ncbi:MAG: hydrogenase formation protein HypD [Ferruginibacter sp.]|uniref:hydrogenase formation protein HypD n=1 Tax=Ferruginibacter sp. TaxID=1940288 RepID=UPI00265988EB|nr:hydrogenase formation protein HypD [Ferruginibacter sp.]MDB5278283.1 hydrogenase formation protein HypD [Ferruginibacter sp.]
MKYLEEYRDAGVAEQYLAEIKKILTKKWTIMEICGGQTHSLVKNGLLTLLPENIQMVHGPGCPVCVTPLNLIDKAVYLAEEKKVILCSFGDMIRVPGSKQSLLEAKANGADVRILYSPLEAVKIAEQNPDKEVVFFAVGFETTAPANALSVLHAQRAGITNYSILTSHVLVPPAMEAIISDEDNVVQGFLAAGHVCAIMGLEEYYPLVEKYTLPMVVTGFEPVDLLQGILMLVKQLENGVAKLENQYARVVPENGNPSARKIIADVFEVSNREWRGIGEISLSGYELRKEFAAYDANKKFNVQIEAATESKECIAGDILRGIKKPHQCPQFGKKCNPLHPLGAPMVSSEGACAAYFHFSQAEYAEQ